MTLPSTEGPDRHLCWRLRLRDELLPGGILQSSPRPDSGKTACDTGIKSDWQVTESTGVGSQLFRTFCVVGHPNAMLTHGILKGVVHSWLTGPQLQEISLPIEGLTWRSTTNGRMQALPKSSRLYSGGRISDVVRPQAIWTPTPVCVSPSL